MVYHQCFADSTHHWCCKGLDSIWKQQNTGVGRPYSGPQVLAIDASGGMGGNRRRAGLFFQQATNTGIRIGGLDEHQLCSLSPRPVVDGLEETM